MWPPYNRIDETKKETQSDCVSFIFGGTDGNRTSDTRIFSPLLYQLSYGTSVFVAAKIRHFSHLARKKLQKLSFFYFWKCFSLIFSDIIKSGRN